MKKKSQRKTDPIKLGIATTLEASVSKTKLPLHEVQRAKAAGCDAFKANGRIDCDALLDWVSDHPQGDAGEVSYSLEKALDMRANRKLKEQKLRERDRLSLPIERVKSSWTRYVMSAKIKLAAADSSISSEALMKLGLSPEQSAALGVITTRYHRLVLKELNAGDWGKPACPHCAKELL